MHRLTVETVALLTNIGNKKVKAKILAQKYISNRLDDVTSRNFDTIRFKVLCVYFIFFYLCNI